MPSGWIISHILAPRAGNETVSLGNNLFVFDGFIDDHNLFDDLHILNIERGVWKKLASDEIVMKSSERRKPKLKIAHAIKQYVKKEEDGHANSIMDVESPAQGTLTKLVASSLNQPIPAYDMYQQYMQSLPVHSPSISQHDLRHYMAFGFTASHDTQEGFFGLAPSQGGGLYAIQTLSTPGNKGNELPQVQGSEYQREHGWQPSSVG